MQYSAKPSVGEMEVLAARLEKAPAKPAAFELAKIHIPRLGHLGQFVHVVEVVDDDERRRSSNILGRGRFLMWHRKGILFNLVHEGKKSVGAPGGVRIGIGVLSRGVQARISGTSA
jgi:hypothetical protein